MTINIITFFWSNNLGALIQAFCLKKFLEKECKKSIKFNSYAPKELIERERMSQINKRHLNVLLDYSGPISAPIDKGTKIAKIIVTKKNEIIKELPLYAAEDLKKVNFFKSLLTSLNYLIWGDV